MVGIALAATLLVSGCSDNSSGGSPPSSPTQHSALSKDAEVPSVDPATGPEITAENYTYRAPEGWKTPNEVPGEPDSYVTEDDATAEDGFIDNINVQRLPARYDTVAELEDAYPRALPFLKLDDRFVIDGTEAAHFEGRASLESTEYDIEAFFVWHEDSVYQVTFAYNTREKPKERDRMAYSVLTTWQWK